MSGIADLRREFASRALSETKADADPIRQFTAWFDEAVKAELLDTNAMTLATVSPGGDPAAMEFWPGRPSRLHDRLLYVRDGGSWTRSRLAP